MKDGETKPNARRNDFSIQITQKYESFQVSANFLNDEEQTIAQRAVLGQEMKNLRLEIQEHRVNAVEGNSRLIDRQQMGIRNTTRFCNYCRTNGRIPSWYRKKIRNQKLKRIENERTIEEKSRFPRNTTENEEQGKDQNNGLEVKFFRVGTKTTPMTDL